MKTIKRILAVIFSVTMVSVGCALTLKAAIGVGAWDALSQTGSEIFSIPVGTVGMICNFICIAIQIILLKNNFKKIQLLQIPLSILLGTIINFVLYDVFSSFVVDTYIMQIGLLILGYIVCAFFVGAVMVLDLVTFALESACMAVSNITGKKFHVLRQTVDVVCVIVVFILAFSLDVPLAIREGTIIGMLIFGPLMGIFMKILKPIFKKLDLLEYN